MNKGDPRMLVAAFGCECGRIHIHVERVDGVPLGDADAALIRALRDTANWIEKHGVERSNARHDH